MRRKKKKKYVSEEKYRTEWKKGKSEAFLLKKKKNLQASRRVGMAQSSFVHFLS